MQIAKHKIVRIDYTVSSSDGDVLDSSKGREPLTYLHGIGGLLPGLESALEGKSAGDVTNVTLTPQEAYGMRDENLVQEVPRTAFAGVSELKPGMQFRAQGQAGSRVVTVVGLGDDSVKVDANHPLAGMTLQFDVTVVDVRDATAEELSHGHAHGPGGEAH